MSDRLLIALASIPLLAGALLLVALQRVPPARFAATAGQAGATQTSAREDAAPWLGVVVASHSAELAPEQGGRVSEVWVRAGGRVRRGQAILAVDGRDAASAEAIAGAELGQRRSDVARAHARWTEARAQLARLEQGGSWISALELDAARARERVAQAELAAARAGVAMGRAKLAQQRLRARRHTLEAPFDGVLLSCEVDAGDSVAAGQVLARVVSDDRRIRFAMPRDQLPSAGVLEVLVAAPEGELRARVERVQPELDPAAQLIFAVARPEARGAQLLPGTRVEVRPSAALAALGAPQ